VTAEALPRGGGSHRYRRAESAGRDHPKRTRQRPSAASESAVRLMACLACVVLAGAAIKESPRIRGFEATMAGHLIGFATGAQAGSVPAAAVFWFTDSPHSVIGMQITPQCTVALLLVPFLLATACLVWLRPRALPPVAALLTTGLLLLAMNQFRFLTIAWLVREMGFTSGFYWGHTWIGSLITIFGLTMTLAVYAVMVSRGNARRRGRRGNS
jgi:exosortase/archaeosortase family protein